LPARSGTPARHLAVGREEPKALAGRLAALRTCRWCTCSGRRTDNGRRAARAVDKVLYKRRVESESDLEGGRGGGGVDRFVRNK
jgi:hypothetical protein